MPLDVRRGLSPADGLMRYTDWFATTRRYTERSKREYRDDVSDVAGFLETRCHIRSITQVQRQRLVAFLDDCRVRGQASSTRRRSVAAIRSFFQFLVNEKL